MSRIQEQQKKQLTTNIIFGILILITVVVVISTLGLKLLLNASVFVARLSEKQFKPSSLNKNESFIGDVDIDQIPTATNSSKIIVGGSVVNYDRLEFYLNGNLIKETSLTSSDSFSEEIGDLEKGENEVFVIAKSKEQEEEKKSRVFTVSYKNDKPRLDIKDPQEGLKTNKQEITVSGSTDKEIYVKVNDLPVVVDAQGSFQITVRLKEGENKIHVITLDVAGNTEEKIITVVYEKD
ncbi:hypothetical protein HY357_01425 [Candidatus Roizmanbacteria bacterium]|nr:hypothetical protein [Candidatus Roizmanbacteria bacterium]